MGTTGLVNGATVMGSAAAQQMPVSPNCLSAATYQAPVLPVMFVQPVPSFTALPVTSALPVQLAGMQPVVTLHEGAMSANTSQISVQDFRTEVGKNLPLLRSVIELVFGKSLLNRQVVY